MKEYVEYKCNNGHEYKLKLNSKVKMCPRCKTLLPYFEIKELLEKEGFKVLNLPDDFEGSSKTKMTFMCKKGHTMSSKCSHIRGGSRCKQCHDLKLREDRKTPKEEIIRLVEANNYKFLKFDGEYNNRSSRIEYICDNNHIKNVPVSSILAGNKCQDCDREFKRGSNSPSWKGGRRNLYHQLRSITNKWRKDSFEEHNYTCFISGCDIGGNLVVHHSYNFYKIIDDTLLELNLPIKEYISDYSDSELIRIEDLCLSKHYELGLGIVMTKDLHILFHKIYGNKNNNIEQIIEFKKDYLEGKYNDVKGT